MIIPTIEKTLAPTISKPMVIHIIDVDAEQNILDKALCGHLWDRLFPPTSGVTCSDCQEIFLKLYGVSWNSYIARYGIM